MNPLTKSWKQFSEASLNNPDVYIDQLHRVRRTDDTVIVRFTTFSYGTLFYRRRKELKNGIKVHLELTKARLDLLIKVSKYVMSTVFPMQVICKKILLDRRYHELLSFYPRFIAMTNELSSANVSLLNQYKYIAFNIFSCRIFIISYKMLIITNEKINELAIYRILCRNFTFFYRQEKSKLRRSLKSKFSNSCFVLLHVLVFRKHDISLF